LNGGKRFAHERPPLFCARGLKPAKASPDHGREQILNRRLVDLRRRALGSASGDAMTASHCHGFAP